MEEKSYMSMLRGLEAVTDFDTNSRNTLYVANAATTPVPAPPGNIPKIPLPTATPSAPMPPPPMPIPPPSAPSVKNGSGVMGFVKSKKGMILIGLALALIVTAILVYWFFIRKKKRAIKKKRK